MTDHHNTCVSLNPQIPLFQLLQRARDNKRDQGPSDKQSSKSKTTPADIGGGGTRSMLSGPC